MAQEYALMDKVYFSPDPWRTAEVSQDDTAKSYERVGPFWWRAWINEKK